MQKIFKTAAAFILLLQVQVMVAQKPVDPSQGFVLRNDHVSFVFEPVNMGLASMTDLSANFNHINPVNGKHLLWEIAFAKGNQVYSITNNYKPCSYASLKILPDGTTRAVMEWNRLRWWEQDDALSVTVTIELPKDKGIASWRIFVENNSRYWGLWSVLFPIVNGFPASGKYDIARPSLVSGGELIPACDQKLGGVYPAGDWPMQMVSFSQADNGVYLASMDPEARTKEFVVEPIKGLDSQRYPILFIGRNHRKFDPEPGERTYLVNYPNDMGVQGSDYPDPYPVEFGVHRGGWTQAARIYRPWALRQRWTQKGPLSVRTDIPESLLKLGIWIKDDRNWMDQNGTAEAMNKPVLEAAKSLDVPVGLHCFNWHIPPFNNHDLLYLPAKEGLKQRVTGLNKDNVLVMPCINGASVEMSSQDMDKFKPYAVKDEAGGLRIHTSSDQPGRMFSMCGSQTPWQDVVEKSAEDAKKLYGASGICMDRVSAPLPELCFDQTHLHPLGGGSYWARGNRELMQKVKNAALRNGGNMAVTTEGAGEVFFDLSDANLLRSLPSAGEIPLVQMIYSGYAIFFGSTCDYTRSDNYFRYAQGHAFIDGRQNGWMDLGLFKPEYKVKADYLKQCGKYRVNTLKYLVYGQLLDPVLPVKKIATFGDDGFASGGDDKQLTREVPCAEARLWKSEEGTLAIFFANYTDQSISFPFKIDPADFGYPKGKWQTREFGQKSDKNTGTYTGTIDRTEILEPGRIKVIELVPSR